MVLLRAEFNEASFAVLSTRAAVALRLNRVGISIGVEIRGMVKLRLRLN